MKNKSVVKRKILTVVIGLLLLISYILGNIEMGKLGSKMDYVNLISQGDENGMTYSLAESAHQRNQQSDEPLQFVNWCQESGGRVSYKELKRMETSEIMAVYGRTDLLFSDCEVMDIENKTGCLISKGLAFRLLGGTDVVGNILEYNSREYEVIDVIESDIPLFVYELWEEDNSIVLDRATIICIQNSSKQTKAAYDKVAGIWSLIDYQMIFYGIKIVYFIVPWILGTGLLLSIRRYKNSARKSVVNRINRITDDSIKNYLKKNREWMSWEMIMFLVLFFMILFTVIQIRVPLDLIPDKWSNFEFWSEFYKNKQEAVLLMRSMKRGVVDLEYIIGFQRAAIIGVLSIVEAAVFSFLWGIEWHTDHI